MIYHITPRADWDAALRAGRYTADSLASQGFIHCSTREQVIGVADAFYAGRSGLVLLCIDEGQLGAPLVYENLEGGEALFPHLYGPLNLEAVVHVADFAPGAEGRFTLPAGV
jgi:uncharacterized protein (DUF952 family)